jgi:AcrR family transcriptional regulator
MAVKSTEARIMAAARKLLDREGFDALSMRRLAKAVGITPMALYRHVADHDDLLNNLADAGFQDLSLRIANVSLPANPEQQLMKILDVFLDFALENPRMFELMFLKQRKGARQFPGDFHAGKSPTAKYYATALEFGMQQGIFRKDDVWEIAFETGAMLQGLVMLYVGGRVGMSTEDFRAFCHRSFRRYIHGICK